MAKKRYLLIFGTRPEAIKMVPIVYALNRTSQAECIVCVTGQHQELLASVLSLFKISPQYNLFSMSEDQQPCGLTARLLPQLERVIEEVNPDWVLVQGDTTSAFTGALAAFYAKKPVAHIEAGIRSHNRLEPFPEEIQRRMIDVVANLHFAATEAARDELLHEGCRPDSIHVTGNTCIDAMGLIATMPFSWQGSVLEKVPLAGRRIILVTVHRRENHGQRLESICRAIAILAERYQDSAHFVLPVHPNPNVLTTVHRYLGDLANVSLTPPLGYREMIALAEACYFAMIDSGGLQEELPCLGKPALVLRHVTDRREAILGGAAKLVGTEQDSIVAAFKELMEDPVLYGEMAQHRDLFGDGTAGQKIAHILNSV